MDEKVNKYNSKGLEINSEKIAGGVFRGIGSLLDLAINLEKEGKSDHEEFGEIKGKTESGKEYRGAYGIRAKIGINPEELRRSSKLKESKKKKRKRNPKKPARQGQKTSG